MSEPLRRPQSLEDAAWIISNMAMLPDLPRQNEVALAMLISVLHEAGPNLTDVQYSKLLTVGGMLGRTVAIETVITEIRAGSKPPAKPH